MYLKGPGPRIVYIFSACPCLLAKKKKMCKKSASKAHSYDLKSIAGFMYSWEKDNDYALNISGKYFICGCYGNQMFHNLLIL